MLGEFSRCLFLSAAIYLAPETQRHPFGELPQDEFGIALFLVGAYLGQPHGLHLRGYSISSYDHPVSMLCRICPRRSSQQRITRAESGIMHRSFRAVSLTMELRSDSSTPCMKGPSALQMFIRRHSSSSLHWLAGSLFQSFRSSSRAAAGSCCLNRTSISLRSPWVAVSQESVVPHSSPARPICLVSHKPLFPARPFSSLRSSERNGLLRS